MDRSWEECGPYLREMMNFSAPVLAPATDLPGDTEFRTFARAEPSVIRGSVDQP